MSSRNVNLSADERARAIALSRGLQAAEAAVAAGERDAERLRAIVGEQLAGVDAEYVAVVDPETFQPVETVNGRVLVALAARVGATRLIDNREIRS